MLKRQRPPTAPVTTSCLSDPDYDDHRRFRFAKRQRIVAPILDGTERGLLKYDGDAFDEEEGVGDIEGTSDTTTDGLEWAEQSGQYKRVNAILQKVHLEHQQRLHSPTWQSPHGTSRGADGAYHQPLNLAYLSTSSPLYKGPQCSSHPGSTEAFQELEHVRARYEERNRLLGSLVRQRKEQRNILSDP